MAEEDGGLISNGDNGIKLEARNPKPETNPNGQMAETK
jgi:hypothetical protein